MYNEAILTKEQKYRVIVANIRKIISEKNFFRDRYKPLRDDFNNEEIKREERLWEIYINGLKPKHPNNPEYDRYIESALDFVRTVIVKYVPREKRKSANGKRINLNYLENFLSFKEVESWKIGSNFICVLSNDVKVKRLSLETDKNGCWQNYLSNESHRVKLNDFTTEINSFTDGLYQIVNTQERFDINNKEVRFPTDNHTLLKFKYVPTKESKDFCVPCG